MDIFTLMNDDIAQLWIEHATVTGDADAEFNCGLLYASGHGVDQDYREALKWFLKSAEKGHVEAICNVGSLYGGGLGVDQDFEEAAKWFKRATDAGDEMAKRNLAACLRIINNMP